MSTQEHDLRTLCAHGGIPRREYRTLGEPLVPSIEQSSIFSLGTSEEADDLFSGKAHGFSYSRFGNPTVDRVTETLAELERGAEACLTASGNGATLCAVTMALRGKEDRIVTHSDVYGGTYELLNTLSKRFGIPVDFVDPTDDSVWAQSIAQASVVFAETPSNPLLRLVDLDLTAKLARAADAQFIVDNTLATPCNQMPFLHGADWIVHSTSKYLNGHSDLIGGCVISRNPMNPDQRAVHRNLGGTVNAMDAWLLWRGLRTLPLRMEAHHQNGSNVAEWLSSHEAVSSVHYPGLPGFPQSAVFSRQMRTGGAMVSFELTGGASAAKRFLDRIRLVVHAVSLGGMESLATRPAMTSHRNIPEKTRRSMGITNDLIRLSVGIEALDDLIGDLEQALKST